MSHAIMRVKFKNLYTGSILERTFKQADRFKEIIPTKRKKQFLYSDGGHLPFHGHGELRADRLPERKAG